jgi:hypothetical protein
MRLLITLTVSVVLVGCAAPKYTVDDGRKVNEALLGNIRTFGAGEQALRPAIVRSATLKDAGCDTQWELPFSVATSYDWSADDRVAWVRALGVDERLTVVGAAPQAGLKLGDKLQDIAGYKHENTQKMLLELAERRDAGRPFDITLSSAKNMRVTPFKVCRGYTRLAPPDTPKAQDYHWLLSLHPLEIAQTNLTDDEALWAVLWTQGLSEEGGGRMKTYSYGAKIAGAVYQVFTIVSGLKGVAIAANVAVSAAQSAATSLAAEVLKKQLIEQASAAASAKLRSELVSSAQRLTQNQAMSAMQQAAANRGALTGVGWVAATVFDKADAWAYSRLEKLQANPLAGFSLHQKLIEQGLTGNSMVLDAERMTALSSLASKQGLGDEVVAVLGGIKPEDLQPELGNMPLASAPARFSYDDPADMGQPYVPGLIDSMLSGPAQQATFR